MPSFSNRPPMVPGVSSMARIPRPLASRSAATAWRSVIPSRVEKLDASSLPRPGVVLGGGSGQGELLGEEARQPEPAEDRGPAHLQPRGARLERLLEIDDAGHLLPRRHG